MMNAELPAGIESYLKEAGFTATEMLVLRKLVEQDAMTLREIAAKTGKSTGVLDQATKKLISKKIVEKKLHNAHPRYSIQSLDAVVKWVQKDMSQRKETMERRHKNFETYIETLKFERGRPDMEYFQGEDALKDAYRKLLESGDELRTTMPVLLNPEDDPFREFFVEIFRRRQVRKIFQRVLAPNTVASRRFQSRDPFEYRKTLLISGADDLYTFERIIVGDVIACIDRRDVSGCFIRFPGLARSEKAAFDLLWQRQLTLERGEGEQTSKKEVQKTPISLVTQFFSSVREFLLSKKSLVVILLFAIAIGVFTFGLERNARELNLRRLQETMQAIVATGASQLESGDIDAIWTSDDVRKPEYAKLVSVLNLIRRSNADIQYSYILRKTTDPTKLAFVADADSLDPTEKKDVNLDGVLDSADALNTPGELYDFSNFSHLQRAFEEPVFDLQPYTDQWGTFLSAAAPIRNSDGETIAVLGVDIFATKLDRLTAETFIPVYAFLLCFLIAVALRYISVHSKLLWEIVRYNGYRQSTLFVVFFVLVAYSCYLGALAYRKHLLTEEMGKRLMAIATTAAPQFDPNDLEQLHWARDMKTEAYQRVYKQLNEIRNRNPEIKFAYIFRKIEGEKLFEFIIDADANFNLPYRNRVSIYDLGPYSDSDENAAPGVSYYDYDDLMNNVSHRSKYGTTFDQWGHYVSGMAPIFSINGSFIGIIGFDAEL